MYSEVADRASHKINDRWCLVYRLSGGGGDPTMTVIAGPKRGQPTVGFSIFASRERSKLVQIAKNRSK